LKVQLLCKIAEELDHSAVISEISGDDGQAEDSATLELDYCNDNESDENVFDFVSAHFNGGLYVCIHFPS
jgi:hypothetical protein